MTTTSLARPHLRRSAVSQAALVASRFPYARASVSIAGLALLSACAGGSGSVGNTGTVAATGYYSTDYYIQHAAGNYRPPGPSSDPWGPYIRIASRHFDVPQPWIRQVMQVESGGHEYLGGQLTVSSAGAMGLMQLEPETYQEMADRYGLGGDPFNPYDNIMAGTAYIHEMYTVYGSPGFLAAYNAGPGRLDHFINDGESLPDATQQYVAMIAPEIQGYYPQNRSEADQLALNTEPMGTSTGILPPGFSTTPIPTPYSPPSAPDVQVAAIEPPAPPQPESQPPSQPSLTTDPDGADPDAVASNGTAAYIPPSSPASAGASSALAFNQPPSQPEQPAAQPPAAQFTPAPIQQASYQPAPTLEYSRNSIPESTHGTTRNLAGELPFAAAPTHRFNLISPAMADMPRDVTYAGHGWAIQVGAYATREKAKNALGLAELSAVTNLMHGEPLVERIDTGYTIRYRARFVNLPHTDAISACHHLSSSPLACTILSPDAQG